MMPRQIRQVLSGCAVRAAAQQLDAGEPVTVRQEPTAFLESWALENWAEHALDQLDAGFFSGDTFHGEGALARVEWYLGRWQREIVNIREMLRNEGLNDLECTEEDP
jgi:hypothetical protein